MQADETTPPGADAMQFDYDRIRKAVIKATVKEMISRMKLDHSLQDEIEKLAAGLITAKIEALVAPLVAARIDTMTFPQTTKFGEPKGPELTWGELVDREMTTYLTEKVGYDGKKDQYHGTPRLEWLVRNQVQAQIAESVRAAAVAIKDQIGNVLATVVKSEIDKRLEGLKRWQ